MKQLYIALACLIFPGILFAQKEILNPVFGMSNVPNLTIEKIELTATATILSFNYKDEPGTIVSVPSKSYIKISGTDELLYVTKAEGLFLGKRYFLDKSGEMSYRVFFPPVPDGTPMIEFGEAVRKGDWHIYDIQLQEPVQTDPDLLFTYE